MKVRDVCRVVDDLAPPSLAYSWDKVGLQVGDPDAPISSVLVALTVTRATFDAAREVGAEMIVSHHPVIFEPLKALRTDEPSTRLCLDIAEAGIACYVAHTNLDIAPGGVNHALAERLGLVDTAPLFPSDVVALVKLVTFVPESHVDAVRRAVCEAGAGVIGEYTYCTFSAPGKGTFRPSADAQPFSGERLTLNEEPELRFETLVPKTCAGAVVEALKHAHPYEEVAYDLVTLENRDASIGLGLEGNLAEPMTLRAFAAYVRERLELTHVRVAGDLERRVRRVGVVGGSGGSEIVRAAGRVDVYLTGDIKYHDALEAVCRDLAIVDAGHAGTEKWIVPRLADYLRPRLDSVRVEAFVEPEVFTVVV
ncbi:MAG TPA: Nif3-like dinuclear metal center hexameric protein [Candidatus Hydrogenedentes bacterium]|nr:Nif3-like dinuclear metal center hexameric protein [Candidatus Hydrogenedentota bacterium]HPG66700.1 Nif3-like dinuclear metal center hexameric protein [Candidatus Hydrogenedentota bacterium]